MRLIELPGGRLRAFAVTGHQTVEAGAVTGWLFEMGDGGWWFATTTGRHGTEVDLATAVDSLFRALARIDWSVPGMMTVYLEAPAMITTSPPCVHYAIPKGGIN